MLKFRKYKLLLIFVSLMFFISPPSLYSSSLAESPHLDKSKLPKGCGSCHKGHGVYNTAMLPEKKEVFCFRCHGHSTNIEKAKKEGDFIPASKSVDMQRVFEKSYHHPVEKSSTYAYTGYNQTLPAKNPAEPRNVQCIDCHHHHFVTKKNKMIGIKGVGRQGTTVNSVIFDYELCFKCHANSANLPADQINKAEMFNVSNPSYHPVIAPGRNSDVPSLIHPLTASSTIKCIDCHNNDDSLGPKGPHGSIYKHILKKNFAENDGPEGTSQYDLCYSCHRRSSILGNESFRFHSLHISAVGTSCKTCHNPHGSLQYPHLLSFDNISIRPSKSGRLEFMAFGRRAGQCYLNCHGKNHNPASYPVATSSQSK